MLRKRGPGFLLWLAVATLVSGILSSVQAQKAPTSGMRNPGATTDVYFCPMHPEVRATTPGACPRCKMGLVKAAAGPGIGPYVCPAHPGFESPTPGACRRCGNPLISKAALMPYRVEMESVPAAIHAGETV